MNFFKSILISLTLLTSFAFSQVNINSATLKELTALFGIGEVKAKAIIKYRKSNGKFSTIDELINVDGIGKKTLDKIHGDLKLTGKTDVSKIKMKSKPSKKTKDTSKTSNKIKDTKTKDTKTKDTKTKDSKTKGSKTKGSKTDTKTTDKSKEKKK